MFRFIATISTIMIGFTQGDEARPEPIVEFIQKL